jgi:hypothetical protein
VIPTAGNIILLGDTFIRSVYLVFDADNLAVGMAQARYGVDENATIALPVGTGLP